MGISYFVLDCCGEIWADIWGDYYWCVSCDKSTCIYCLEHHGVDTEQAYDEDFGGLLECPNCDQFRHMNENYGD